MNIKIGSKIKSLRARDSVTQEKLATALGVTAQAVSKWESENGYPDLEYLTPIANFFNVTLDELFEHDLAEKQRKIDEYCARCDELARSWSLPEKRVELMRQALAEFPANEKLLHRLATALWDKWDSDVRELAIGTWEGGKYKRDQNKVKSIKGWEEPTAIMEDLLATSVDDVIRYCCTQLLVFIYSDIGEKERAIELANHYPDSKDSFLSTAFMPNYEDESLKYSQQLIVSSLFELTYQLPRHAIDLENKKKTIEKLLDLYEFVFSGQYNFYNVHIHRLYVDYAETLLKYDQIDEAFKMLEKAFERARAYDVFLDKLRAEGEVRDSSIFTNKLKSRYESVGATKVSPWFLKDTLKDENNIIYKKLQGDPRYADLVKRVEEELAKAKRTD